MTQYRIGIWMWVETEDPGHSKFYPEEAAPNGNQFFH